MSERELEQARVALALTVRVLDDCTAENEALRGRLGTAERLLSSMNARPGSAIDLFLRGDQQ